MQSGWQYRYVFWPFEGGFKVTSGTVEFYIRSSGTDFDNS